MVRLYIAAGHQINTLKGLKIHFNGKYQYNCNSYVKNIGYAITSQD